MLRLYKVNIMEKLKALFDNNKAWANAVKEEDPDTGGYRNNKNHVTYG